MSLLKHDRDVYGPLNGFRSDYSFSPRYHRFFFLPLSCDQSLLLHRLLHLLICDLYEVHSRCDLRGLCARVFDYYDIEEMLGLLFRAASKVLERMRALVDL